MDDEIALAIRCFVNRLIDDFDAAKMGAEEVTQELVVIAGHIDEARALARLAQQLLHHVIMRLRPIPAALQPPAVDDIADKVDRLRIMVLQEVQEKFRLAAIRAEVNIGQKKRPVTPSFAFFGHEDPIYRAL